MKDLHTEIGSGHEKTFLESASKQANVLSAEEYFVHVDFAMAEFTIPKYPLHKLDPASNPRDFFASVRSCNWKRFVFEYLSREQPVQIVTKFTLLLSDCIGSGSVMINLINEIRMK
jgi:hypothetical protein